MFIKIVVIDYLVVCRMMMMMTSKEKEAAVGERGFVGGKIRDMFNNPWD